METEEMKRIWERGSYDEEAVHYLPIAGHLVNSVGVGEDDKFLDVGCGTGNVAVTAARCGAEVTGVDILPEMLKRSEGNAEVAGVGSIGLREGDATDLPFDDDAFDVTLSCLGHMYGDPPHPTRRRADSSA
jgi:ubiquinone/menaquinone biosynthesis C-methylase UbiE